MFVRINMDIQRKSLLVCVPATANDFYATRNKKTKYVSTTCMFQYSIDGVLLNGARFGFKKWQKEKDDGEKGK